VNQANTLLEKVGHHVQSVILDTFRALPGVIVKLVQKARKRQAGVCVRRVLQEKQIRQKLSNRAGNVTRASMLKVLAN
jgi:glycerol-3-phosphate responsive antiterminator